MNAAGALPPALVDLLGILPDAVLIFDGHGVVTYVNPAVQSLLGYAPDEIVGRSLSMLVPPESRDRHDAMVAQYHREGTPKTMGERPVLRAVHKSGRLVPVSISL
ncbi:MAG TPA: PAS domain S-box protein, partial [Burkholderiaceae bacterium]|nr:PAS domain S-box protein [Burkholderiaceae bacterium]